ncbi:MAG: YebC/PmpR family DNA-binding transcriptional regulator [Vampirovibrionales bacterium]|nr:YebC/PmpR family DNA-binding transcriptional regulator [Vampirovibrionales bacterium]
MAGHSKWAQIKRQKAVKDVKKGQTFARYAREIMVATKMGGPDPDGNFRLRTAIDHAKAAGLPNDNIKRAIEKGQGIGGTDNLASLRYEGYGAGGVAIMVEALSENRNRTAGDIRSYFNKYDGNLGAEGCVAWMFDEIGLIRIPANGLEEATLLDLVLEVGAEDIHNVADEAVFEIVTPPEALNRVCQALTLKQPSVIIQSAEITRKPKNINEVTELDTAKKLLKLLNTLESHDDVQAVHANVTMDDELVVQALFVAGH